MARSFLPAVLIFTLVTLALPLVTLASIATPEIPPEIENAKNSAVGEINADSVYVRSGAGDNYYPTQKLNTGAQVTVVGVKFDWLKIIPPEGSFCYVSKQLIDKGAGDVGTVNRDDVNVRAGSALNAMKTTVQGKLSVGQQVKILGEQDEYYKIAPPPDAFVYVKKDFVKVVKAMPQVANAGGAGAAGAAGAVGAAGATATANTGSAEAGRPGGDTTATTTGENTVASGAASTQPSGETPATPATEVAQGAATTQPTSAEAEFDKLESDFTAASAKAIDQQPVAELLGGYQKLIANPQLPESMRRIADYRAQTLKARAEAREQFAAMQKKQEEAKKRQQSLKAEQEEIAQQIKKNDVQVYTAVGTLRTSSLQQGASVLYRLTDPQTGHTVCYIRSDDPKIAGLMGQFIGVKGQLTTDPALSLKVVTATETATVDPNQLFRGVAAQLVPPSLIPAAPQPQQASATGS